MTNQPELKLCPFCGSRAELKEVKHGFVIKCTEFDCQCTRSGSTRTSAVKSWNTRTEPAAPVADDAVEALARAIYCLSPADEMPVGLIKEMAAKACLVRLSAQGYTLRRETMTEAELEREAERLAYGAMVDADRMQEIINLAKKYRG